MGIIVTVKTTANGHVGQVASRKMSDPIGYSETHYVTPEYLTQEMAMADAKCWKEFHMTDKLTAGMTLTDPNGVLGVITRLTPDKRFVIIRWDDHTTTSHAYATVLTWIEGNQEAPAREYTIYEDDKVYESGALMNTSKVLDFIGKTLNEKPDTRIKHSELRGMMTGYEGFVLHICIGNPKSNMIGNWRTFHVIKANQKAS